PFIIMAGALDGKSIESKLLSYQGPFGVGYAVAAFTVLGEDPGRHFDEIYIKNQTEKVNAIKEKEGPYVRLARQTLENYIIYNERIKRPDNLSKEMTENSAGVFVTLHLDGQLRGCIGTTSPATSNIADEIIQTAISAGLEDPRFPSVTE